MGCVPHRQDSGQARQWVWLLTGPDPHEHLGTWLVAGGKVCNCTRHYVLVNFAWIMHSASFEGTGKIHLYRGSIFPDHQRELSNYLDGNALRSLGMPV